MYCAIEISLVIIEKMKKTLKNERECIEENSRKYNRTLANRKNNLKETKKSEVRLKSLNT